MRPSETLKKLGPILADHPRGLPILRALASVERFADDPTEADWSTAEAVYWLSYGYHGGQWCPLYAAGCATEFHPSPLARGCRPSRESFLARESYRAALRALLRGA